VYIGGGTMEFGAASSAPVFFLTNGALVLDDTAHFTGTVSGIAQVGDTIDLAGIAPANVALNFNPISGALELHYGPGPTQFIPITGGIVASAGSSSASDFILKSDGNTGTDVVFDPGPVIQTNQFGLSQSGNDTTITGLSVSDPFASFSDTFTISAVTAGAGSGTSVTPSTGSGSLAEINSTLASVTYNPGSTPPATDKITLAVTDSSDVTDTVSFIFNQAGTGSNITLQGTPGKDVIFATGNTDTLTGGGGQDQFVFKPTSSPTTVEHTITDFNTALDTLDVRQFAGITASALPVETQQGGDTLVTLDAHDTVLLKNVLATSLHAGDFIVHA
jgi:Ca2+-binding RTX toxin-like protein